MMASANAGWGWIERAISVLACVDSDAENIFTCLTARELRSDITIVARASVEDSEKKLLRAGADRVISPYKSSGAEMARLGRWLDGVVAGQGRVVKLDKPSDFVGRAALERVAREGVARRLVGLTVKGRGIARHGYPVDAGERRTGIVTSGTQSPTLGKPIAMAYVAPDDGEPGTILAVEIRGQRVAAEVVPLPFYKRPRST